ncbi:MAG: hypothetical protein KDB37_19075 [Ilumatobacter sp.]|nr:hypothetical protein [Ilumatobacter sp.]
MEATNTHDPQDEPARDAGATTVEYLGWAAMSTVAIVAIGAALQVLGLDLIDYVRTQLGI